MPALRADALPALAGRTLVVTGANSGLGFESARAFERRGARVVMACRSADKAKAAEAAIRAESPQAELELLPLNLASLASVRAFARDLLSRHAALHALVNNAGVMALPRRTTADGFEMQLGTNHLGHFALTGLLLETLRRTPKARVVSVSSLAHFWGRIAFDDLQSERSYNPTRAYGQSRPPPSSNNAGSVQKYSSPSDPDMRVSSRKRVCGAV